jgi:lipopolysaccharide biosynthesis glycosyltransferase
MKNQRIILAVIFLSMIYLISFKTYRNFIISSDLKKEEKNKLKRSAEVLNECIDLKNKSERTLNDSMKLIEYCLKEYGSEK